MVRTCRRGAVWTLHIDRADVRNAVDRPTAEALVDALTAFEADPEARVAVLTGEGGNFCAGADLKSFGTARANRLEAEGTAPMGPSRMTLSKPVIAAIEGFAVAGGLELACWCDLRVVAESAVLGVFCRRWGVPLIDGGTIRLPDLIGQSHAMDLILTGRPVHAAEALSMGLANRVVPDGSALTAAIALAEQIASHPWDCAMADRASVLNRHGLSTNEALAHEFTGGMAVVQRPTFMHGVQRFASGEGRHGQGT